MKIEVRRYRAPIRQKVSGLSAIFFITFLLFSVVAYLFSILHMSLFTVLNMLLATSMYMTFKDFAQVKISGVHDISALKPLLIEVVDKLEYSLIDEKETRMEFSLKKQKRERLLRLFSGFSSHIAMYWYDDVIVLTGPVNKIRWVEDKLEFSPRLKQALQEASA